MRSVSIKQYLLAGEVAAFISCTTGNSTELSLTKLSKRFALNQNALQQAFKQRYRKTVHAYIVAVKMEAVCNVLQQSQQSIKAIALESGYTALSNFSRDFSKFTGLSPLQWRQQCAAQAEQLTMSAT